MKAVRLLALVALMICSAVTFMALRQGAAPKPAPHLPRDLAAAVPSVPQTVPIVPTRPSEPQAASEQTPLFSSLTATAPFSLRQTNQTSPLKKGKDPIKDPLARQALAWVGCNEEAEAYWIDAINDLTLSAQERQDLIEDLNEDGLSDPKQPTVEDLPVILNRLELIELLAPQAKDQINADAFLEAYKDLVNLAQLCVGAGEPVR